ncbi:MAG: hypothetical protein ABF290_04890, partial [Thiogranum sp.]
MARSTPAQNPRGLASITCIVYESIALRGAFLQVDCLTGIINQRAEGLVENRFTSFTSSLHLPLLQNTGAKGAAAAILYRGERSK